MAVTTEEIVRRQAPNSPQRGREPKMALCLSGGGYRAMLYHVGALRRLNELGFLPAVDRFSSASGGSITAAVLAHHWSELRPNSSGVADAFDVVERVLFDLAGTTIDVGSTIYGVFGTTGAFRLAARYRRLFEDATLQDLPEEPPRFVFNTTNMVTGNAFRWSRAYGADYGLGRIELPELSLAEVVAASSAFPPFLSPMRLRAPGPILDHDTRESIPGQPEFLWLTDGGVYDNLALQTAESFHTVLVSDGGSSFRYRDRIGRNLYAQHRRAVSLMYDQVRRLRQHQFIRELRAGQRLGALWRISADVARYSALDKLDCPLPHVQRLAATPTRLAKLAVPLRRQLINWGYASCDAAIRSYVEASLPGPREFPHPGALG